MLVQLAFLSVDKKLLVRQWQLGLFSSLWLMKLTDTQQYSHRKNFWLKFSCYICHWFKKYILEESWQFPWGIWLIIFKASVDKHYHINEGCHAETPQDPGLEKLRLLWTSANYIIQIRKQTCKRKEGQRKTKRLRKNKGFLQWILKFGFMKKNNQIQKHRCFLQNFDFIAAFQESFPDLKLMGAHIIRQGKSSELLL